MPVHLLFRRFSELSRRPGYNSSPTDPPVLTVAPVFGSALGDKAYVTVIG
jgi:hypothetical protein